MVSIIIPLYNSERFIGKTVESILNQTYADFEVIIVDDGSTDGSADIVKTLLQNDRRVRYVYQENKGSLTAKNHGVSLAKGEYVAFCDSDDLWLPEKLEKQINVMEKDPAIGLTFTKYDLLMGTGEIVPDQWHSDEALQDFMQDPLRGILRTCFIAICSVMVRKEVFVAAGGFDESLWFSDWEWYVRVIKRYRIDCIPKSLFLYRQYGSQMTNNYRRHAEYRIKTVEAIWQDPQLCKKYPKVRRQCYAQAYRDLAGLAFGCEKYAEAKDYLLNSFRWEFLHLSSWHLLMKCILGKKIISLVRNFRNRNRNSARIKSTTCSMSQDG